MNKGLGGGGGKQTKHLSNCRKPFVCLSYTSTPSEKNQNCRENGVCCHNFKARQQTQTKKGKSTKKTEIKNTTTIKTPTTEKPGGPKCKKLGFGKGDAMELALKESNKLKKGRKKKEDRTESKKNQNGRSKGFDELQRKTTMVFQIERAEKTKKKKTKSKSRILSPKTTLLENHPFVNP